MPVTAVVLAAPVVTEAVRRERHRQQLLLDTRNPIGSTTYYPGHSDLATLA
jgi:hypothetical protein